MIEKIRIPSHEELATMPPLPVKLKDQSLFLLWCLALFSVSCTHNNTSMTRDYYSLSPSERSEELLSQTTKNGMVVAAHPAASQAGLDMLKGGGNAIDAMVAASFAISVVRPQSTGIGGGGFAMLYDPESKKVSAFDFRERAPSKASPRMFVDEQNNPIDFIYEDRPLGQASLNGHLASGVPGNVYGLISLHNKYGKLPRDQVLAPAIQLARKGFKVYPMLAASIERRKAVMLQFPASKKIFFKDEEALKTGDILIQNDLANTLELIRDQGIAGFYEGEIAEKIAREMQTYGGLISQSDLKKYKMIERKPLETRFREHDIYLMPPPSSGGVNISQILRILDQFPLENWQQDSLKTNTLLIEAMRYAFADRALYLGDPDFVDIPLDTLLSKDYLDSIASKIKLDKAGDSSKLDRTPIDSHESSQTTHISVMDAQGMVASSTQTINFLLGSGLVIEGTGILLNNEMNDFAIRENLGNVYGLTGSSANSVAANKTMLSSMTPTIVLKDAQATMSLGSPGGSRIMTAILQVLINRLVYKNSPSDSVQRARLHHQWLPDKVWIEDDTMRKSLEAIGYQVDESAYSIGDIQAIFREQDASITGVSDHRGDGEPRGY